ncbi:carboxypeptidase-like regulatory domain-containing protein [Ferruginibacter sp.]|nr:T9SS type A sorting domain-containing protein [Ferruginibacter sp.]
MQQIQLSIPEPCHQNWQQMTPTQQGRFCNACAKQVIDFSVMSDAQVLNYFSNLKNEKVCGRAFSDQLERTIAMPKYPRKKMFWYWNYAAMLFLFFSKSNTAKAQGAVKIVNPAPSHLKVGDLKNTTVKKTGTGIALSKFFIKGTITDEDGQPVSFASIRIANKSIGTSADEEGKFSVELDRLDITLRISAIGYEVKEWVINDFTEQHINLKKNAKLLDKVIITSSYSQGLIRCMAGGVSVRVVNRNIIKDTVKTLITNLTGAIKIYPNPVKKGNSFNLSLKLKRAGMHSIQITDAAGRMVLQKQINSITKLYTEQMPTNSSWAAGIYYIRVADDKNNLISTNSFSLQ